MHAHPAGLRRCPGLATTFLCPGVDAGNGSRNFQGCRGFLGPQEHRDTWVHSYSWVAASVPRRAVLPSCQFGRGQGSNWFPAPASSTEGTVSAMPPLLQLASSQQLLQKGHHCHHFHLDTVKMFCPTVLKKVNNYAKCTK